MALLYPHYCTWALRYPKDLIGSHRWIDHILTVPARDLPRGETTRWATALEPQFSCLRAQKKHASARHERHWKTFPWKSPGFGALLQVHNFKTKSSSVLEKWIVCFWFCDMRNYTARVFSWLYISNYCRLLWATRWHVWAVCWWKMSCPVCQHSHTAFKSSCSSLWRGSSVVIPFQQVSNPYALIAIRHSKYP